MSKKAKKAMCNWCLAIKDTRSLRRNEQGDWICRAGAECDKRHRSNEVKAG